MNINPYIKIPYTRATTRIVIGDRGSISMVTLGNEMERSACTCLSNVVPMPVKLSTVSQ